MPPIARMFVLLVLLFVFPPIARADLTSFQSALSTHLVAIERRDIVAFEATLAADSNLTLVTLDGTVIAGKSPFVQKIRGWFADPDWTWKLEPLSVTAGSHVGIAIYHVAYQDLDRQRKPYNLNYVLTLVFAKQGEEWRLVHDQNTLIDSN